MTPKHKEARHTEKSVSRALTPTGDDKKPKFEIVLKADSDGSMEALEKSISGIDLSSVDFSIIHRGIGDVNKSDVLMAETGNGLIIGFQVDLLSGVDRLLREHRVEVRLYHVIYRAAADIGTIVQSMVQPASEEQTIGSARIIALFKSSRKGIILGCKVLEGHLAVGQHFRLISAMGPVYSGHIESMHIGETVVQRADPGQQVGIKVRDFKGAKIGDLVESYRSLKSAPVWKPAGEVIRKY